MPDVLQALRQHFGHADFRPGQRPVVEAVLAGEDVLAVMPTGAGKSLGFQLPALMLRGLTLVVSPLISLMKDQVDELQRRGVAAAAIHSGATAEERREAAAAARGGRLRLLYVAPERFAFEGFVSWLAEVPVARFVVDEAHCISEWGHDFRPDYRRLGEAAHRCRRGDGDTGRPPIAAFTATATPEVRADIEAGLGLQRPRTFVAGFDRPNIELRVQPVSGDADKRRWLRSLVGRQRALVYASTRASAEQAAQWLVEAGCDAAAYHAGLDDAERRRVQDGFAAGTIRTVCATNAFGMGIDRPDIDCVVHVEIPGSIEAYYQEVGRAGRDGRAAVATLLWNYADVKTREFLIDARATPPEDARRREPPDPAAVARRIELDHRKLRRMVGYAKTSACLRATILRYFGDTPAREPCDHCGNCLARTPLDDEQRLLVRKILSGIARAGERFGRRRIVDMLVGKVDGLPEPLAALSTTGLLRDVGAHAVEAWLEASVGGGLVRVSDDQYHTLGLTPLGREVMAGRVADVRLVVRDQARAGASPGRRPRLKGAVSGVLVQDETAGGASRAGKTRDRRTPFLPPDHANLALVDALKAWRREVAAARAVPAFVVLSDRTVYAIAAAAPRSIDELAAVPGIGPAKLAQFGPAILDAVARAGQ